MEAEGSVNLLVNESFWLKLGHDDHVVSPCQRLQYIHCQSKDVEHWYDREHGALRLCVWRPRTISTARLLVVGDGNGTGQVCVTQHDTLGQPCGPTGEWQDTQGSVQVKWCSLVITRAIIVTVLSQRDSRAGAGVSHCHYHNVVPTPCHGHGLGQHREEHIIGDDQPGLSYGQQSGHLSGSQHW